MKIVKSIYWASMGLIPLLFITLKIFFWVTRPPRDSYFTGESVVYVGIIFTLAAILLMIAFGCAILLTLKGDKGFFYWPVLTIVNAAAVIFFVFGFLWFTAKFFPLI